jgi:hypothetical protein
MLILESQLRSIIKQELKLVLEDKKSFLAAVTGDNMLTYKSRKNMSAKDINTAGRNIKKLWAAHADHNFMSKVNTIHWWGDPGSTPDESPFLHMTPYTEELINFYDKILTKISRKDELSTMGSLPEDTFLRGGFSKGFGVLIKGRVTLAAKTMNSLDTGYFAQGEDYIGYTKRPKEQEDLMAQQIASSGYSRRPSSITKSTLKDYILDEQSFGYDETEDAPGNEFLVDNWKPIAIVIDSEFLPSLTQQYKSIVISLTKKPNVRDYIADNWANPETGVVAFLKYLLNTGLPILDTDKNQITEEQLKPFLVKPAPLKLAATDKNKTDLASDELWEKIQKRVSDPNSEPFVALWMFEDEGGKIDDFIHINTKKELKDAFQNLVTQGKLVITRNQWGEINYTIA